MSNEPIQQTQTIQATVTSFGDLLKLFVSFVFKKKWWIVIICTIVGVSGAFYNYYKSPSYIASLMFAVDDEGSDASGYLNIAAQFGITLGNGGGGAFKGENLLELFKSRYIIEKTLVKEEVINGKNDLMINHLIESDFKNFQKIRFSKQDRTLLQDSILTVIYQDIIKSKLDVSRIDKRLTFVGISFKSHNQLFSKLFVEQLLDIVVNFYTETKTRKTKHNVGVIIKELDSVKALMTSAIYQSASSTDLNVNPVKQMVRAQGQRSNIDAQVYTIAYGEIMKNLEIAKMTLMKETPLVQVIDRPVLPLENDKKGRASGFIIWSLIAFMILMLYYYVKFLGQFHKDKISNQS